jgi:hypothetical protein
MVAYKARRAFSISVPILTAALLFGIIPAVFNLKIDQNIASTGITLQSVFAILQVILFWMIYKNRL